MKLQAVLIFILGLLLSNAHPAQPDNGGIHKNEGAEASITWLTLEEAQKKTKKDPKKIFIDVYTDWCGWCKKMDKTTFSDPEVVSYVKENYYAVKLDAETKDSINFHNKTFTGPELAKAFKVSGFPTIVFFNENFSRFQPVSGFRPADSFLKMLKRFNEGKAGQDS